MLDITRHDYAQTVATERTPAMIRPLASDIVPLVTDRARAGAAAARYDLDGPNRADRWDDIEAQRRYVQLWESVAVWATNDHTIVATVVGPADWIHGASITGQVLDYSDNEYIWTHGRVDTEDATGRGQLTWTA